MFDQSSWLLRRPPMWVRWALSLGVAAALGVGLVVFVSHHNDNLPAGGRPKAEERANLESEIVVSQDQAPHVVTIAADTPRAVIQAIRHAMTVRIANGQAVGPLQHVRCTTTGTHAGATGYRCRATAAGVGYPYQAVLNRRTRTLTFCKHDAPPVPSMNIPVSPRCRLST
jgi:hypothetical protein